jgi:hypothetical protein
MIWYSIRENEEVEVTLKNQICSLYRSKYSNLKLAETTMGRGPGRSEEVW